ncbi:hypothetical protein B0H21DRAFT_875633 [Amylocystis lapponica]|nr:hypothetical protein B0H21DRAFT_875633 [Amylocystis lapponica]
MNRHHPYAGPYDGPPSRRGFGDRGHRFSDRGGRGRGFRGRGRGGGGGGGESGGGGSYGGYDGSVGAYDQGPPQGDMGGYNNYDSAPPQDPFYQNGNFNASAPGQYAAAESPGRFSQDYGNYEDGSGPNYAQGGYGSRPPKRVPRRERDDKVHDSIIEERIQRERPCRTLFIRNIKYETNSEDIRTFFDLIANRGMVFVTYRLIPVQINRHASRSLRNSATGQAIDDGEVRRKFQQFGDVKAVRPSGDRIDQRFVEFYDTRACDEAHDRLRHQGLQDGVMDIVFASDGEDPRGCPAVICSRGDERGYDRGREWEEPPPTRGRRGGRGRGRGRGLSMNAWNKPRRSNRFVRQKAYSNTSLIFVSPAVGSAEATSGRCRLACSLCGTGTSASGVCNAPNAD